MCGRKVIYSSILSTTVNYCSHGAVSNVTALLLKRVNEQKAVNPSLVRTGVKFRQ